MNPNNRKALETVVNTAQLQQLFEAKVAGLNNQEAGRNIVGRLARSPELVQLRSIDWAKAIQPFKADFPYPGYYLKGYHGVDMYERGYLSQTGAMTWDAVVRETFAYLEIPGLSQAEVTTMIIEDADKFFLKTPQTILDLGTGTGHAAFAYAKQYPTAIVDGIDLAGPMLAVANYRAEQTGLNQRMRFSQASADNTGFPTNSYDVVTAWIFFHELPADFTRKVLQEAYRVCKPGGVTVVYDAFDRTVPRYIPFAEPYLKEFQTLNFRQELEGAGFREVVERPLVGGQWYALGRK